jgi:hypothetical protein
MFDDNRTQTRGGIGMNSSAHRLFGRLGRLAQLATVLVAVFALAAAAAAQTDVTTTRISGTVTDAGGAPLPGVAIEATNRDTGLMLSGVTDENGFYRILNIPSGTYTITATLDGFGTGTAEDVRLVLGSTPSINFDLQSASVAETITVTADEVPIVETTNTTNGVTIQTEQIAAMPLRERDFRNLVLLTPQTRLDSERGNLSISGQRGINTNVTIDGVDFNNAFFGGTVGGAEGRAPLAISQESIKEFSVVTNGASVEFGRSGGGFVNVITKSGTNNLHGSVFYYNQPQSLISDFANGREAAEQERDQFGGSIGGAIVRDKLFYFASYDQNDQAVDVPITASVLDAGIFARYPVLASPDLYTQTRDGDVAFGRLDYQMSPQHRLMGRVNITDYEGINGTSDSQTRTASFNGVEGLDTKAYVGSWNGQFTASLLNDLNLNYITEDTPRADKGLGLPEIQLGSNRYGEVGFLPIVSTAERQGISDTVTYLFSDHVLKGGLEYNDTTIDQIFKGNWRGVFIFNNRNDLLAGNWREYRQFGGLGGLTSDQAGKAAFGQKETALFFQDQWFVRNNLTMTAGVRFESLDNPDAPALNPNDRNANGSFNLTREVPDADLTDQISPRLGISWAPDQKTAIRFSAGRFWSRTPAILLAQLYTSNGLRGTQYIITARRDAAGNVIGAPTDPLAPGWGAAWSPQGIERIDFTRVPVVPRPGVFTIDDNFDNPYTDRFTLGAEREIMANTGVALDFTYAETEQLQRLKDINRVYDGTLAINGLPRYSSTTPFPFYGRITTSVSDSRSEYFGITGTVRRRLANRLAYNLVVTYSEDKDNDSNERNFAGIQAEDYNNIDLNWGWSNRDQRWKTALSGLWESPWWGLMLSGSLRYSTGSPYNAVIGQDVNNDGEGFTDRPTVGGSHFARNSFRQPDFMSLDMRLGKDFALGPGEIGVFAECFNCTDEANRSVNNFTWGTGQTPNAAFGQKVGVGTPRSVQFGVRYDW